MNFRPIHTNQKKILFFLLYFVFSLHYPSFNFIGQVSAAPITINYTPSTADIANPERGFMKQSSIFLDQPFDKNKFNLNDPYGNTDTLVWVYFRLDNYRLAGDRSANNTHTVAEWESLYHDALLNGQMDLEPVGSGLGLDIVKKSFDQARNNNLKLIIRFIYNPGPGSNGDPYKVNPDVPLEIAQHHLNQLQPHLQANPDVIAAVQVGFVGHWGEWHSSKYLQSQQKRRAIINAVLEAAPPDRMLMIRYPRYIEAQASGVTPLGGPISATQAFNQSDLARLGFHNDAFLRDSNDGNTYESSNLGELISPYCNSFPGTEVACWKDYISQSTRYVPMGGEAGTHDLVVQPQHACSNALAELQNLHFSFLNYGYNKLVLDYWKDNGCMPDIRKSLGYRFVLKSLNTSSSVAPGSQLTFNLTVQNQGYATPYNFRPAILVLTHNSTGQIRELPLTTDPQRWTSGGATTTISESISIPSNLANGTYSVYLWLPDASAGLRANPAYAIQFANQNTWQASTGYNLLYSDLQVSGTVTEPTATPIPSNTPKPTATPTIVPTITPPQPGDTDGDRDVDIFDYSDVITNFGTNLGSGCAVRPDGDVAPFPSGDCKVDILDYSDVIANFGTNV